MRPRVLPTRRTYAWLAVAALAFAVYASLIPFTFRWLPLGEAVRLFTIVMTSSAFGRTSRTNFLANVLLFLPVGFGLTGALLADRGRRVAAVASAAGISLLVSIAVSLTAEFLQVFAPGRVPARSDVEAQTIGCLVGIAAWLVIGPPLTAWLRDAENRNASDRLAKALLAYAAAWTFVNLAPFDITLDLGELAQRVRSGLISIVPFAGMARPTSRIAWDALVATVSAAPLGVLGFAGWNRGTRRRTAPVAFAIGAAFVLAMEVAQIFIASHAADMTDVIFGWLGVAIGVLAGGRALTVTSADRSARLDAGRRWSMTLLAAWCIVLPIYHWMPYDFSLDAAMIRSKIAGMSIVPFAGYARGSDLNAFNDLLVKLGLSVPLGVIGAFVVHRTDRPTLTTASSLAAATMIFAVIEAGQVFIPSRSPDPSDVLVGVAGTAVGLWLGRWLRADR